MNVDSDAKDLNGMISGQIVSVKKDSTFCSFLCRLALLRQPSRGVQKRGHVLQQRRPRKRLPAVSLPLQRGFYGTQLRNGDRQELPCEQVQRQRSVYGECLSNFAFHEQKSKQLFESIRNWSTIEYKVNNALKIVFFSVLCLKVNENLY